MSTRQLHKVVRLSTAFEDELCQLITLVSMSIKSDKTGHRPNMSATNCNARGINSKNLELEGLVDEYLKGHDVGTLQSGAKPSCY
jgi:hypothetical protein